MCQIAKEVIAARVVSEILNGGATVSVSVRTLQIGFRNFRKTAQDERPDGRIPAQIDQLLVRLKGISA